MQAVSPTVLGRASVLASPKINRRDAMDTARQSRNQRQEALTAEYAEYAENRLLPGSPSAYSAYSAVYLFPEDSSQPAKTLCAFPFFHFGLRTSDFGFPAPPGCGPRVSAVPLCASRLNRHRSRNQGSRGRSPSRTNTLARANSSAHCGPRAPFRQQTTTIERNEVTYEDIRHPTIR
jgi:hypothetical protein